MSKQVYNPYLPDFEYIPDGEPHIFGDRLYIYGSHDKFDGIKYCENDYVCWSAPVEDLSDWKYEGVIYKVSDHPMDEKHIRTQLYAPDITQGPDGRYYLYYSMADSSVMSVAVCDTPVGKFKYYGDIHDKNGKTVGPDKGELQQFDPSIFIDDDGRIFLYSGFAPTNRDEDADGRKYLGCHVSELEKDMLTIKNGPTLMIPKTWRRENLEAYFEAPSMRKINGLYYFVYSARATGLYYYYGNFPDHDFKFGGRIHSTSDYGLHSHNDEKQPAYPIGNIHGGIVKVKNQYYIFDHRHTNNSSYNRQGVAEPIFFDENGRIKQVEETSCGLNGGPLLGEGKYPASICCNMFSKNSLNEEKLETKITQDIPDVAEEEIELMQKQNKILQYVKDWKAGVLLGYKYFEFKKGICEIKLEIKGKFDGTITAYLIKKDALSNEKNINKNEFEIINEAEYKIKYKINFENNDWITAKMPLKIRAEKDAYALYFVPDGEGSFDIKSFEFI